MTGVAADRQFHLLVVDVLEGESVLEASRKLLVLERVGKAAPEHAGFDLDFLNLAQMRRALEISFELER